MPVDVPQQVVIYFGLLPRLLQRYQNVKSELEAQQNIERIRADRYFSHATMKRTQAGHALENSMQSFNSR